MSRAAPSSRLLLQLLVLLLAAAVHRHSAMVSSASERRATCQSVECVTLAAEMASRMNLSADPCHDFYNFACGNFPNTVKYNPLKASQAWAGQDMLFEDTIGLMTDKLEKNIFEMLVLDRVATSKDPEMSQLYKFTRLFFRSCNRWIRRNERLTDPKESGALFRDVFTHLAHTIEESERVSLESILASVVKVGGKGMLGVDLPSSFAEDVVSMDDYNLTNTARASIAVRTMSLGEVNFAPAIDFLVSSKVGHQSLRFANKSAAFADIWRDLEATLYPTGDSDWMYPNCTVNSTKTKFTVQELDQITACTAPRNPFSWKLFFEELLQSPIEPNALVEVPWLGKVIGFVNFFKSRPVYATTAELYSDHIGLLIFDWLLSFANFFPLELREPWISVKFLAVHIPKGEPVTVCMMWTKWLLQPIVERMYQRAYHREDFNDIKQLVQLIQKVSIDSVRRQPWMTRSAKNAIVKKIQSMKHSIGLDDLTAQQLKDFYNATLSEFSGVNASANPASNFGHMLALSLCAYSRKDFDIMAGSSPVTMFMSINPLMVNAFNWIQKNQIIFPMAILAPPVYHPSYPEYINLGSLGYIIGHEIGHSFDNMGHTINQLGAIGHFWDNETEANYITRMECVRSCYGNYTLYPGGPALDSNSTLGNDIADILGIKAAIGALKALKRTSKAKMQRLPNLQSDFSPEQLLFLQAAQGWCMKSEPEVLSMLFGNWPTHSPHHLRIKGFVQNSQEFADAYKCKRGSQMNPKKMKCDFW